MVVLYRHPLGMDIERWLRAHGGIALLRTPTETHLWAPGHSSAAAGPDVRWHRGRLLGPRIRHALVVSEVDALAHVAECLPRMEALIVWESALRQRRASLTGLHRVAWAGRRARRLAADLRHDARLMLEGYRVLRFSYDDIVHHWDRTVRIILAAIAQGLAA